METQSVSELIRENEELKITLRRLVTGGYFWNKSGADDSREVRVTVPIGALRDAFRLLEEG